MKQRLNASAPRLLDHSQEALDARIPVRQALPQGRSWTQHLPVAPPGETPEFCGPSSTEFTFNTAASNLRDLRPPLDSYTRSGFLRPSSTRFAQYGPFMKLLNMDPLWDLQKQQAIILVNDWFLGLGDVYPIVNREVMLRTANNVFDALEVAANEGLKESGGVVAEALFDQNTNKLKIVLAIGLTKETGGRDHRAERLFQSTTEAIEGLLWNAEGIHGIQLLYLAVSPSNSTSPLY